MRTVLRAACTSAVLGIFALVTTTTALASDIDWPAVPTSAVASDIDWP
ncbi:hypothetical protein [Streptomyces cahuitamycinicus]|nr:hypothetical protein [Streptomyces cahuitamycinicus]